MDTAFHRVHSGTGVTQLVDHGVEVVGPAMAQHHVATGGSNGAQEGARFDAVGHHLVGAAM